MQRKITPLVACTALGGAGRGERLHAAVGRDQLLTTVAASVITRSGIAPYQNPRNEPRSGRCRSKRSSVSGQPVGTRLIDRIYRVGYGTPRISMRQ